MVRVALCDDERMQLDALVLLIDRYARAEELQVIPFSSGDELLETVGTDGSFDLYLLDVVMPGLNGIELGRRLRERGDSGQIVYLTSSPEFALESYQIRALNYILKPFSEKELFETLDRAVESLRSRRADAVIVRGREMTHRLLLDDILYAETYNRAVRYHMSDGQKVDSVSIREPFHQAVGSLLKKRCFAPCGASYVINLNHVAVMEKTGAVFKDGNRLPLSKQASSALRSSWMNYWLEEDSPWS